MFTEKEKYGISDLLDIMKLLRSDKGCPWDKEQDHKSIRMNVLEEACEVMEAIDMANPGMLKEELGDLLLQIAFHCEISAEANEFDFEDVCDEICRKLIYRHPHVFADTSVSGTEDVLKNWNDLKCKSKGYDKPSETLDGVPVTLPALMRAQKVGKKAALSGMDFATDYEALISLKNEVAEFEIEAMKHIENGNNSNLEQEFGDFLFSICNLARFFKIDCEKVLTSSINKFIMRFKGVENHVLSSGREMTDLTAEELDVLWEKVKSGKKN